jgi:hypothetical protein
MSRSFRLPSKHWSMLGPATIDPFAKAALQAQGEARMNRQFLKDHLLDFEVIAALGIGAVLRYGFDTSWLFAILFG